MEIWKDIPGYEGFYQASSLGRIKSLARTIYSGRNYLNVRHQKETILRFLISKGYAQLTIYKNKIGIVFHIHKLVAMTFLIKNEKHTQVNHIDGNKLNNAVENLEWCTAKENSLHAVKTGLRKNIITNHKKNFWWAKDNPVHPRGYHGGRPKTSIIH